MSTLKPACYCLQLEENVIAKGNVELWLSELLTNQQKSLHSVIREASNIIGDQGFELLPFIANYPAQVSMGSVQLSDIEQIRCSVWSTWL